MKINLTYLSVSDEGIDRLAVGDDGKRRIVMVGENKNCVDCGRKK